jgi:tetrapyrrole methylase family protein/MazG family protein
VTGPAGGRVVVIGLGPGAPGDITEASRAAADAITVRFLRTARHPTAASIGAATSFDDLYEAADTMDEVYGAIATAVAEAARRHGEVLYAVPGSPLVAERTVELLRAEAGVEVEILPALSFVDLAWARLGVDPFAAGVHLVDGHRFALEAAGQAGPLLVAQCDTRMVLSDIKLSVDGDHGPVTVLQRLGLPDEAVVEVAWADLDRDVTPDHLTCIWIPHLAEPVAAETVRMVELMRTLRSSCPWDREQTHQSLRRHLLEESYEVLDAIDELPADGAWEHLEEELGDLLFQVVFHAHLAGEEGQFTFADVARRIHDKLVDRHPHVFAGAAPTTAAELDLTWEQRKKLEKGRSSVMDGIPGALPSLLYAQKMQKRATSLGLDWPDADAVWPAVTAELEELRTAAGEAHAVAGDVADELGDVLFSVVNLARKLDVDPELALRGASTRFRARVAGVERLAAEAGLDDAAVASLDPARLDALWQEAERRLADS